MTTLLVVSNATAVVAVVCAVFLARRLRQQLDRTVTERLDAVEIDGLTELPDRTGAERSIHQAYGRAQRHGGDIGVVAIDLAGLGALNESLGRTAGDDVLREIAARLRGAARVGEILGRIGGDSFALVLEAPTSGFGGVRAATRLLRVIAEPVVLDGDMISVRAHAGVAVASRPDDLLDEAEIALSRAMTVGSAVPLVFEPSMRGETTARFRVEQQLADAVSRGEFTLAYQPVHRTGSLSLVGFEALARWTNPVLGPVPPGLFIPIAESNGRIVDVGAWVLRRACDDLAALLASTGHQDLVVSVNVSVHQLAFGGFAEVVGSALETSAIPPANLQLEITESMLAEPEQIGPELASLRRLGVRLALDDVGTGYSSLAQIASLPIDAVKIDRSLVVAADDDGGIAKVLGSIADLGRSLDLDVIAEGVETTGQLTVAVRSGCTFVQGYLLARPMPFRELESYATDGVIRRSASA